MCLTPTAEHVQTARRLLELHGEAPDDGTPVYRDGQQVCWWCLKRWPCQTVEWSQRTIAARGTAEMTRRT